MKFIFSLILFSSTLMASELAPLNKGFDRPECAYIYGNHVYISNMAGPGNVKDGIGWIQKYDRKGNLVKDKWVQGLNAPKGLRAYKDTLYTTDIDQLVMIDLKDGKFKKVSVPGSVLLNDIVIDAAGNLLISDTFASKIFRMDAVTGAFSELFLLTDAPNGLFLLGETLYVAGYGKAKADASGMEEGPRGSFMSMDLKTREKKILAPDLGKIDGVELLPDGQLLITVKGDEVIYWIKDGVITGSLRGASSIATLTDVADIGYDPISKILYVPNTKTHDVQRILIK